MAERCHSTFSLSPLKGGGEQGHQGVSCCTDVVSRLTEILRNEYWCHTEINHLALRFPPFLEILLEMKKQPEGGACGKIDTGLRECFQTQLEDRKEEGVRLHLHQRNPDVTHSGVSGGEPLDKLGLWLACPL